MFEFENLSESELAKLAKKHSSGGTDPLEDSLSDSLTDSIGSDTSPTTDVPKTESPLEKMIRLESVGERTERSHLKGMRDLGTVKGFDNVNVEGPKGLKKGKRDALQQGLELVSQSGYDIPDMDVSFAQKGETQVRNVAFMEQGGHDKNSLFLSDQKLLTSSKKFDSTVRGGIRDAKAGDQYTTSGERGIADQIGDLAPKSKGKFNREKKSLKKARQAYAKAVVVHEMGHVLHKTQSPDIFWDMKVNAGNYTHWKELAADVSQYAMLNPLEFIAEVFTGVTFGLTYGSDIMDKYTEFGGPTPKPTGEEPPISDLDELPRSHSVESTSGGKSQDDI